MPSKTENARTAPVADYRTNRKSCAFFGSFYLNVVYEQGLVADATVCAEFQCDARLAAKLYKRVHFS